MVCVIRPFEAAYSDMNVTFHETREDRFLGPHLGVAIGHHLFSKRKVGIADGRNA